MMKKIFTLFFICGFLFFRQTTNQLSALDLSSSVTDFFYDYVDPNEGTTSFRSLLIPFGGKAESLGNAFTGLSDDISFLSFNPAGSSIQKETQFAVFHNSWISDSNYETIAYTTRFNNFGFGVQASCFYVPFTEYNIFGDRTAGCYYTETTGCINLSYNFLNGYNFKGLAIGINLKGSWRGVPNYADNDTNQIIENSGLNQSALGLMADLGFLFRFNLLKFYNSREANVKVGFSARNLGVALTNFGSNSGVKIDDPLPTILAAGISITLLEPITLSFDFKQPINLFDFSTYLLPSFSVGFSVSFTTFFSMLIGAEIKGGNPKISAGAEFQLSQLRMNLNYTLDLSSSTTPLNRISLSGKIMLGDRGRHIIDQQVDEYYMEGLKLYSNAQWQEAIQIWEQVLKLNKRFDPAILGIESARAQINMFENIKNSLKLE